MYTEFMKRYIFMQTGSTNTLIDGLENGEFPIKGGAHDDGSYYIIL